MFLFFLCKEFYTSARVDSTTSVATSLGSNSSSHVGIDCCIGGVGSGTKIFKVKFRIEEKQNDLPIVADAVGILTTAVSACGGVVFSGLLSSCCFCFGGILK